MFTRPRLVSEINERLNHTAPATVLLGPRQVGKTTLARAIVEARAGQALYLDLERPADRARLTDADDYLRAHGGKLVVIDEIHRAPGLFDVLRGVIDERRRQGERYGHFLLLGSASMALMQQAAESLTGRLSIIEVPPLMSDEVRSAKGDSDKSLWVRGGFPESVLAPSEAASLRWRRDFIRSYIERDVPMFAPRLPTAQLGRLWTMLAHQQGAQLNLARLGSALGVAASAAGRYLDLLCDLMLVRRLKPYSGNVGKRVAKAPKLYVRDSGLVHALLDIPTWNALLGHPVCGMSYEGFVIENLLAVAGDGREPYFYRTHDGAEIDLVFERAGELEIAIEIKRSSAPKLERGFTVACNALNITKRFVVYPGAERFSLRDNVEAISLQDMMDLLAASG